MAGSKTKYVSMVVLMLTALVGVAGGGSFRNIARAQAQSGNWQ